VSSAEETAKDVYRVLTATGRLRDTGGDPAAPPPRHRFVATGDPEPFRRLGRRFLGPEIDVVQPAVGSVVPA
jgi:glutamate racemase